MSRRHLPLPLSSFYSDRNMRHREVYKRLLCASPSSSNDTEKNEKNEKSQASNDAEKEKKHDNLPIKRIEQEDDDYYDDFESSGSKNSWKRYVTYAFSFSLLGLFGWAGYSLAQELFGRSSPNNLFSETFEKVRYNDEIILMTGSPMKAYGQDSGRRSEGRRNHVANRKYDGSDGSKRTRIRYTVSGPKGKAIVYAEVSDRMENHEFVYLIVKHVRTGRVHTLEDNRDMLDEKSRSSGATEGDANPLSALLKGFGGN